jgi:uroporphyrinogen-III synthase
MRIWVTRTAPDNGATAARLETLGHEAIAVPVLQVRAIEGDAPRGFAAIVFSSANGVRHHPLCDAWLDLPVFTVGDRTADAAIEAGYRNVRSADGDVADLQRLIMESLPPSRIVHFGARETAGDLAGFLGRFGFVVDRHIVYATEPVPLPRLVPLRQSLSRIDGIMIHSPRAADRVAKLLAGADWQGRIWCISEACAVRLAGLTGARLYFAAWPTETAMIEMIRQHRVVRMPARTRMRIVAPPPQNARLSRPVRLPANDNPLSLAHAHGGITPGDPENDPPPAA